MINRTHSIAVPRAPVEDAPSLLIVDDDPADLQVLVSALENHDYRLVFARSGEECLRRVAGGAIDLVVLDVRLPGIDGLEVCRRLKSDAATRDMPVIFITALTDAGDRLAGFAAGGIDYIAKPFQLDEVMARVTTHLELCRARKQLAAQNAELERYRRSLEQQVAEQTERIELMSFALNRVHEAAYLIDPTGRCLYANEAACKAIGHTADKVVGMTVMDVGHSWTPERWASSWERLCERGSAILEDEHRRKDGSVFPVEVSATHLSFRGKNYALLIARDITAQKAADRALRASEQAFRAVVENSPNAVMRYDRELRRIYANPAMLDQFGLGVAVLGSTPNELSLMPDPRPLVEMLQLAFETGQEATDELLHRTPTGELRWAKIHLVPERDAGGEVATVLLVAHDIHVIRESEQRFRTLAEHAPDPISRFDRELRRTYVNPAMRALFRDDSTALGSTPLDNAPSIDGPGMAEQLRKVFDSGKEIVGETQYRHPDSGLRWAQHRMVPEFGDDGQVNSVLLIARDVHDIKESEQRFRTLADNFPDLIGRYDRDCRIIYANAATSRELGLSADEMLGRTLRELDAGHANDRQHEDLARLIRRAFDEGEPNQHDATWFVGGEERAFEIRLVPEADSAGTVTSVLGIARDVTLRKRYEAGLLERVELEMRMSRYIANAPGYFYTMVRRPDGTFAMPFASPGIRDTLGLDPADVAEDIAPLISRCSAEDGIQVRRAFDASERELSPLHAEYRIQHPVKGTRWIESRALPHREPDGSTIWYGFKHDITERIAADETIRRLNADLSATLQAIPDLLLEVDAEGTCHQVWAQKEETRKEIEDALLGRRFGDSLPEAAAGPIMDSIRYAATDGSAYGSAVRIDCKTGTRWLELSVARKAAAGSARFLVLARDVTWRKQHEACEAVRLRILEQIARGADLGDILALVVEYVEQARPELLCTVMVVDPASGWLRMAAAPRLPPEFAAMADGIEIGEGFGSCGTAAWRRETVISADVRLDPLWAPYFRLAERCGLLACWSEPILDSGGDVLGTLAVYLHAPAEPESEERDLIRQAGNLAAIAIERRRIEKALAAREREFRSLAENSPYIIVRYDREGRRIYVNPEFERVNGIAAADAFGTRPGEIPTVVQPAAKVFTEHLEESMETATPGELDLAVTGMDGKPAWWYIRFVPEFGADGAVVGALALGSDITERKAAERRLRESYELLRELASRRETAREEERARIAREIHDELGQHLTALRMGISTLRFQFGAENPRLAERTQGIMTLADKTIQVVRDVATSLRPAAIDRGIVAALEWLALEFSRHNDVHCDASLPEERIDMDDRQSITVFRIVQESLTNAARHAGATRVDIALGRDGNHWVAEVCDDGCGFDPAQPRRKSFGLVGMKERVTMLGGDVRIDSAPGCGTRVTLRIPINPPTTEPP